MPSRARTLKHTRHASEQAFLLRRDLEFESGLPQRRVLCEPLFNARQTGLDKQQAVQEKLALLACYREGINAHLTACLICCARFGQTEGAPGLADGPRRADRGGAHRNARRRPAGALSGGHAEGSPDALGDIDRDRQPMSDPAIRGVDRRPPPIRRIASNRHMLCKPIVAPRNSLSATCTVPAVKAELSK